MNNQLVTVAHNVRLSQWNEIFKDRENSELTVDEYCKQHELSKNAYYYWLRRCREKAISQCSSAFAELIPKESSAINAIDIEHQAVLEVNGIKISVSERTSRELLSMILEVSRNA